MFEMKRQLYGLYLLNDIFVDGFAHVKDFESSLLDSLDEGGIGDGLSALAGDVVDLLLILLHAADVVLERRQLFSGGGRVISQQLGQLLPVGRVLVDTELDVLGELLEKLDALVFVLDDFIEHFQALFHQVLADHLRGGKSWCCRRFRNLV